MTRPPRYKLPKYVQGFVDRRDGRAYHYFRRHGSPRVRLPGLPWSPEFMAAYQRALDQSKRTAGKRGSIADAVASYVDCFAARGELSPATQTDRRRILQKYIRDFGHKPIASVTTDELTQMLASMPPGAAENLLKAIRGLMKWSREQGSIKTDPSASGSRALHACGRSGAAGEKRDGHRDQSTPKSVWHGRTLTLASV